MNKKINAVLYLNTHFSGVVEEEGIDLESMEPTFYGPRALSGQNELFQEIAGDRINLIGVIAGGDNYVADNEEKAVCQVLDIFRYCFDTPGLKKPNMFFAGPCYKAGRYGHFSQLVCKAVSSKFGIPAVAGMYEGNAGVSTYRDDKFFNKENVYIVKMSASVIGTVKALERMISLAEKLINGEEVRPKPDFYIPRGCRVNVFSDKLAVVRAFDMLIRKHRGEDIGSEIPIHEIKSVPPAPAILKPLSEAKIILLTTGGVVPVGNPDKIASCNPKNWGKYSFEGLEKLIPEGYQSVHCGYANNWVNQNPNWILPLDLAREMEKKGVVGKLHDEYFATVGNGLEIGKAEDMMKEILKEFPLDIDGAIVSSA